MTRAGLVELMFWMISGRLPIRIAAVQLTARIKGKIQPCIFLGSAVCRQALQTMAIRVMRTKATMTQSIICRESNRWKMEISATDARE